MVHILGFFSFHYCFLLGFHRHLSMMSPSKAEIESAPVSVGDNEDCQ